MADAKPKEMAATNMSVAIIEHIIKQLKPMKEPWSKLPEIDQRVFINGLDHEVRTNITKAVNLIAADKRPVLEAVVDTVTMKDGIKATLKIAKSQGYRHELFDSQGAGCLVIITDPGKFMKGELPKADKDQRSLIPDAKQGPKPQKDARTRRGSGKPTK